jgi:hypothetical protein
VLTCSGQKSKECEPLPALRAVFVLGGFWVKNVADEMGTMARRTTWPALRRSAAPVMRRRGVKLLGREIKYTGHNFDQWEQQMRAVAPAWTAFDLRAMFQGYFGRGFADRDRGCARDEAPWPRAAGATRTSRPKPRRSGRPKWLQ